MENIEQITNISDLQFVDNWKTMDVKKRNVKRLEGLAIYMRIKALLIEIIKNGLENSTNKILKIYIDNIHKSFIFINRVENVNFEECLKTFGGQDKDTNFHEGLSLLAYVHFQLSVLGNYLESVKDETGYFLSAKIGKCASKKEWRLELFFEDKFEEATQDLTEMLESFYLLGEEQIFLNNERVYKKRFPIEKLERTYCFDGAFEYKINKREKNQSILLWKLANIDVYQQIPSTQLDNLDIDGYFVFSSVRNFANENRNELSADSYKKCIDVINEYKKENANEHHLNQLLNRYTELKESMITFIARITNVSSQKIHDVFFNNTYTKQTRLENCSQFIETLYYIDPSVIYKGYHNVILFKIPDSKNQLDNDDFKGFCTELEWEPKSINIELGIEFFAGEIGDMVSAIQITNDRFYYVLSNNTSIVKAKKFKGNFLYMSQYHVNIAKYMFEPQEYVDSEWKEKEQEDFGYEELMNKVMEDGDFEEVDDDEESEESEEANEQGEREPFNPLEQSDFESRKNFTERTLYSDYHGVSQYDSACGGACEAQHYSDIPTNQRVKREIHEIEFKNVSIKEGEYYFVVMNYARKGARAKIPMLYTKPQFQKLQKGYNVTTKVTITKWNAFRTAVQLLVEKLAISGLKVRPIFSYVKNENYEAFYNYTHGLLCINLYHLERIFARKIKSDKIQDLLELVAHELAHVKYPSHTQNFINEMHEILRMTREKVDFNGKVQTIKKHVLDQF